MVMGTYQSVKLQTMSRSNPTFVGLPVDQGIILAAFLDFPAIKTFVFSTMF